MFRTWPDKNLREEISALSARERNDFEEDRLRSLKQELDKREKQKADIQGMQEVEKLNKEVHNLNAQIHEIHEKILKKSDEMGRLLDEWKDPQSEKEVVAKSSDTLLLIRLKVLREEQVLLIDKRFTLFERRTRLIDTSNALSKKHNPYHGAVIKSFS